jgi:hypothetical protein
MCVCLLVSTLHPLRLSPHPATFRELGPPDLCHVVKSTGKSGQADVRTSCCVRLHAHSLHPDWLVSLCVWRRRILICLPRRVHQLTYLRSFRDVNLVRQGADMEGPQRVVLVSPPNLGTSRCLTLRSCFNAFARVDVRVDVRIPGGVNAYIIDLRGERCGTRSGRKNIDSSGVGTTRHQKSGKKLTSPLSSVPFCTQMTQATFWMRIAAWTQSPLRRPSCASCRPLRRSS